MSVKIDSKWEESRASRQNQNAITAGEGCMLSRQKQDAHHTYKPLRVLGLLNHLTCILRTRNVLDVHCANQQSLSEPPSFVKPCTVITALCLILIPCYYYAPLCS